MPNRNIGFAYVSENFCLNKRFCAAMASHRLLRCSRVAVGFRDRGGFRRGGVVGLLIGPLHGHRASLFIQPE